MFSKPILGLLLLAMAALVPFATAGKPSSRYDPNNQCGAPFCGSAGGAAAAGALAREDRGDAAGIVNDKVDDKLNDKAPKM